MIFQVECLTRKADTDDALQGSMSSTAVRLDAGTAPGDSRERRSPGLSLIQIS